MVSSKVFEVRAVEVGWDVPFGVLQPERIVTNVKGRIVMKKTVREILMRISLFPSLAHMGLYRQIYIPELGSLSRIFGQKTIFRDRGFGHRFYPY